MFFGARGGSGFVQFVDTATNPFYAPFRGIVESPEVADGFTLAIPDPDRALRLRPAASGDQSPAPRDRLPSSTTL
ncbi:MAG: hypothetical protein V9E87_11555 [Gemmatimonadales bacterium]